jgi:phage/plasmid-like protein (TIGR03299 family)
MAHNINTYIGRQSAWHALGTVTGKYQTWSEILAHGGLDFDVFKSQLRDGLGRPVEAYGTFRWNRADRMAGNKDAASFLGAVGKDYTVMPHSSGFGIVDALMGATDGAHYETAGVLGNGEVVWGLADLGLRINIGADETIPYLMFTTSHDGSYSYQFRLCHTRVVCQNTLNAALGERARASLKIRHTKSAMARVQDARATLESIGADVRTMEEKLKFLASRRMTRETVATIFDRLFPKRVKDGATDGELVSQSRRENVLADILTRYDSADNGAFPEQRGTSYNLLNAITEHTDHARSSRGDGRAESALFGSGDRLKTSALNLILAESQQLPPIRQSIAVDSFESIGLNVR